METNTNVQFETEPTHTIQPAIAQNSQLAAPEPDRLAEAQRALENALTELSFAWGALRDASLQKKIGDGNTTLELELVGGSHGSPMRFKCSVYFDSGASTWHQRKPADLIDAVRAMTAERKAQIVELSAQIYALQKTEAK